MYVTPFPMQRIDYPAKEALQNYKIKFGIENIKLINYSK